MSVQVRKRDKSQKVVVEESKYETVDSMNTANILKEDPEAVPGLLPGDQEVLSSLGSDSSDEFSWVQRLQHIPDKVNPTNPSDGQLSNTAKRPWITA